MLLATAVGAAMLAAVAAIRRWGTLNTLLMALVGYTGLAAYTIFVDTLHWWLPTLDTAKSILGSAVGDWSNMLDVHELTKANDEPIMIPMLFTWAAAITAITLILRTPTALAPIVPLTLTFIIALFFSADQGGAGQIRTLTVLASAMTIIVLRVIQIETDRLRHVDDRATFRLRARVHRLLLGSLVITIILGLATAGSSLMPIATGAHRLNPRTLLPARLEIAEHLSPLVTIKSQLREQTPRDLFTIQAGIDGPSLVRTAVLESFDGALWTSDDAFMRTEHELAPNRDVINGKSVTSHVTIQDLDGPYLPTLGWPIDIDRIDLADIGYSSESGVLASNAPTLQGMSYILTSEMPADDSRLGIAASNLTKHMQRYTYLPPGLPPLIAAKAQELTIAQAEPYAKLTAIEHYLQALPYSLNARPGHSYDAIARILGTQPDEQIGYAEQHAAAFAVLARSQNFPTRVVVGYRLNPTRRRGDIYQVTSHDAHAWAEVNLTGYGWISFDPTKPGSRTPSNSTSASVHPTQAPTARPVGGRADTTVNPNLTQPTDITQKVRNILLVSLLTLLLILPTGTIFAKMYRRGRRRHARTPATQIIGAWHETTDLLMTYQVTVSHSATAQEIAKHAAIQLGDTTKAATNLAPLVTAAIFSPDPLDQTTINKAWNLETQLRHDLLQAKGRAKAIRAKLNPRPLIRAWHHPELSRKRGPRHQTNT